MSDDKSHTDRPAGVASDQATRPTIPIVLVVEDDQTSRRALVRLFRLKGWQVVEAATLAEGFGGLDHLPACIVLDLMLPDGDGSDLLRHVRKFGLPSRVVVATGVTDPARLQAVIGLHPDSLIRKPIDFDSLWRGCRD